MAIAMSRHDRAIQYLLTLMVTEGTEIATDSVAALATSKYDQKFRAQVEERVGQRDDAGQMAIANLHFV